MNKLSKLWQRWCEKGLKWPHAYDNEIKGPSVTLLMFYFATIVMFTSLIFLHFFSSIIVGTLTSIAVWIVGFVMYRMRKLDKFKFDLDDQEIELDSSETNNGQDKTEQKEDNDNES